MRQDLEDRLVGALDETARKRLLAYALKLVKAHAWPGEKDISELAQDIVSDAVCSTITGQRRWDPATTPDPLDFLFSSIKSIVWNRAKHSRNTQALVSLEAPDAQSLEASIGSPLNAAEADEFFYDLLCELDGDEVCKKMLSLFESGYKLDEIAEELNLSNQEIYAAKKRLQRKTRAYLENNKQAVS